jgi:hypothetical protein
MDIVLCEGDIQNNIEYKIKRTIVYFVVPIMETKIHRMVNCHSLKKSYAVGIRAWELNASN